MADTKEESDDATVISVDELTRFAACLSSLGTTYTALANWLQKHGVTEIQGGGTPTAKLGLKHLGNFTSSVLTGYQKAQFSEQFPHAPADLISKAMAAEGAAKNLALPRKKKK